MSKHVEGPDFDRMAESRQILEEARQDREARKLLLEALIAIRDHWACQYDHPKKQGPMYSGSYGIGVTDGHRCAAEIARAALVKAEGRS
jgi:hypothetical protein